MNTPKTAIIESIPVSELLVEDGYNVRSPAEVKANAKDIASLMEHRSDDATDPLFRVRYVERDGKKYTRSHATLDAAKSRGWKRVNAECVTREYVDDTLDLVISNNSGHPLPREQQGKAYARLHYGVKESDEDCFKRTLVGEVPSPNYIHEPMDVVEIAKIMRCSRQHIDDCITMFEAPPEIAALVGDGKLSRNVYLLADKLVNKHHDGKKGKLMEVVRASIANAREDGKETATPKHFEAIKDQFIPLKAATNGRESDSTSAQSTANDGDASHAVTSEAAPSEAPAQQSLELTPDEEKLFSGEVPKKHKKAFESLISTMHRWNELTFNDIATEDLRRLASAIVLSPESPF